MDPVAVDSIKAIMYRFVIFLLLVALRVAFSKASSPCAAPAENHCDCKYERALVNTTVTSLTEFAKGIAPMVKHIEILERTLQDLKETNEQEKQAKPPRCGHVSGYKYYAETGSCYRLSSDQMTWPQASATCHKEGAYLAIINSNEERLVFRAIQQEFHLGWSWIGFNREVSDRNAWRTINGRTLEEEGYKTWRDGFPINDVSHIYGGIDYDGALISEPYHAKDYIICEKKPVY